MGSSVCCPFGRYSSSEGMSGRAWQNRALSDIVYNKKGEWLTTRVHLLYADTLHRFFGLRRNHFFGQIHRRPPPQLMQSSTTAIRAGGTSFHSLAAYNTATIIYIVGPEAPHMPPESYQTPIMAIANMPMRAHAFRLYSQRCPCRYVHTSRVRSKVQRRSMRSQLAVRTVLMT